MCLRLLSLALVVMVMVAGTDVLTKAMVLLDPPDVRVLFLGDRGHHRPQQRAAILEPALAKSGVRITYSEKLEDLNPKTLAKYDVILLYANIDRIEPAQERALLDFVAGGRGFVPVHCASFCFRNSPAFVKLVGAQFRSHGTGVFRTRLADRDPTG